MRRHWSRDKSRGRGLEGSDCLPTSLLRSFLNLGATVSGLHSTLNDTTLPSKCSASHDTLSFSFCPPALPKLLDLLDVAVQQVAAHSGWQESMFAG
jgi:hypothetical protein